MSSIDALVARLVGRITHLERVVNRMAARQNNLIREGRVLSVDFEKGLAVVEAQGIETQPVPWLQQAGSIVDWEPPAVGQRMVLFSPSGDIGRGFLLPGGYTDQVGQPSQEGASFLRQIGDTKVWGNGNSYNIETGTFTIRGDLLIEGSILIHNGKNIGHDHLHTGVIPGGSLTGVPA